MALMARTTCPFPVGGRPHRKRGLSKGRLHWRREPREYCSESKEHCSEQLHWQRESREYCSEQLRWQRESTASKEHCSEQLHWQREWQPAERGPPSTWQPMATPASQRSAEAR